MVLRMYPEGYLATHWERRLGAGIWAGSCASLYWPASLGLSGRAGPLTGHGCPRQHQWINARNRSNCLEPRLPSQDPHHLNQRAQR